MKDKMINLVIWAVSTFALVLADQYTKGLAVSYLKDRPAHIIIDGVFELLYSENRGAAFGMMQGQQGFFLVIAVVVLAAAAFMMWRMPSWKYARYHGLKICVIMITAGAIGNMIDRVTLSYVVDFLYFRLINFPIFNVADIYVTCATAVLILLMLVYYKDEDLEVFRIRRKLGAEKGENL